MTLPPSAPQCPHCGFFHQPDYSDVRGGIQEWIETVCRNAKVEAARKVRQPGVVYAFGSQEGDSKVRQAIERVLEPKAPDLVVVKPVAAPIVLHVQFMRTHGHAGTPTQAYRGDAGYDLELCENSTLEPGQWQNLRTGIVAAIPSGYWGHILARSSTWRNLGIRVEPAVIDSSYRGELMVYAVNTRKEPQGVKMGQKLAQIIIVPLPNVEWLEQGRLPPGERGERGYGSSGS